MTSTETRRGWLRRTTLSLALACAGVFAFIAACDSPTSIGDDARIQILLTDYPLEAIESAEVEISQVYLVGGGQGRVDLFNDPDDPHVLDLLDLQDGVTADLTNEVPVPEGHYGQLRLVVDRAHLRLHEGYTFADGSDEMDLLVPSGSVRVNLKGASEGGGDLVLQGGETTVVLVDFDVEQSFVFQGPPENPHGVLFTPVLIELDRTNGGEGGDDDDDEDDDDER